MMFDSRSYRHSIYLDQPGRSTKPADRQVLALSFELVFLTSIPAATASDMYVFASLFKIFQLKQFDVIAPDAGQPVAHL
jgi:hypothetical protein